MQATASPRTSVPAVRSGVRHGRSTADEEDVARGRGADAADGVRSAGAVSRSTGARARHRAPDVQAPDVRVDTVPIGADWSGYGRHADRPLPVPRRPDPAEDATTSVTVTIASPTADLEAATAKLSLRLREQLAATGHAAPAGGDDLAGLVVSAPRESTDAYGRVLYWFRGTLQVGNAGVAPAWAVRAVPRRRGSGWDRRLPDAAAAADVRRDLAVHLERASAAGHCTRDAGYDLLLAFEELTSNAFRHGTGAVDVTIAATAAGWLLVVSDQAPDRPPARATGRDRTLGGMGLEMVERLARDVGWEPGRGRKSVWAELPSHRRHGAGCPDEQRP